jgi:hypothetical protein
MLGRANPRDQSRNARRVDPGSIRTDGRGTGSAKVKTTIKCTVAQSTSAHRGLLENGGAWQGNRATRVETRPCAFGGDRCGASTVTHELRHRAQNAGPNRRAPGPAAQLSPQRVGSADRKSLLLGTALASTFLIGNLLSPTPAHALTNCLTGNPPPSRIFTHVADGIICVNVDNRSFAGAVIDLQTTGGNNYINLYNSGALTANAAGAAWGIEARTFSGSGDLTSIATGPYGGVYGIEARADGAGSFIVVENSGNIVSTAPSDASGIFALAENNGGGDGVTVTNKANIAVTSANYLARAIVVFGGNGNSPVTVENSGNLTVEVLNNLPYTQVIGIQAASGGANSPLTIVNSGDIKAHGGALTYGIDAGTGGANSPISITNSGAIDPNIGIFVFAYGTYSDITINNSGSVEGGDVAIRAFNLYSATTIINSGKIRAKSLFATMWTAARRRSSIAG